MSYHIDQLQPGMSASVAKTVTEADIILFAGISTDTNPAHLDEEFAKTTMFGGRIAHGMLSAGFISAVLGNKLPGNGSIYISQTLKFKAPVRPGDTVTATATGKEANAGNSTVTPDSTMKPTAADTENGSPVNSNANTPPASAKGIAE